MLDEDEAKLYRPYVYDSLKEFLTLTPDPMPSAKQPSVEFKVLPKNLRYKFLDEQLDHPVIVNVDLGRDDIERLL